MGLFNFGGKSAGGDIAEFEASEVMDYLRDLISDVRQFSCSNKLDACAGIFVWVSDGGSSGGARVWFNGENIGRSIRILKELSEEDPNRAEEFSNKFSELILHCADGKLSSPDFKEITLDRIGLLDGSDAYGFWSSELPTLFAEGRFSVKTVIDGIEDNIYRDMGKKPYQKTVSRNEGKIIYSFIFSE